MSDQEQIVFKIILHGGNGRSSSMEAIIAAKAGDFERARAKLQEAADELNEAHKIQTTLIQSEIREGPMKVSLLMVHAQDHLMNAIVVKDLANEIVDLYETLGFSQGGEG